MQPTQNQDQHGPETTTRGVLSLPETEADCRRLALREAGYTGFVDAAGYARTDAEVAAWHVLMGVSRTGYLPGDGGGYILTDAGRDRLALLDALAQFRLAKAIAAGIPPEQLLTGEWDGVPFFEWVSKEADDAAEGYGERLAETYLACHAEADAREVADVVTPAQVLPAAALYLERYGWIQGAYYDGTTGTFTPPACLVGAIGMVCYGGPVDAPAQHFDDPGFLDFEEAVLHLDRYLLVEDGSESYDFNDAKGRTLDQVTDVLRKAAVRPAEELLDALRAINKRNADNVALFDGSTLPTSDDEPNTTDCLLCGAPGGHPYCTGTFGGQMSCADAAAADSQGESDGGDVA